MCCSGANASVQNTSHTNSSTTHSGPARMLSSTDEAAMVSFIEDVSACGHEYTIKEVAELASETAYFLNRRDCNDKVTDKWLQRFIARWPDLKIIAGDKAGIITEESVTNYYRELLCILQTHGLLEKSHRVYIIHDTGVASRYNKYIVESFPEKNPKCPSVDCVQPPMAVVVSCMNATGQVLPPYLVFKGKRMTKELLSDGLPGTSGKVSDNGLLNSRLLQAFLNDHFLKHVPCSKDNPAVILYDGHRPHVTVPLIDWAEEQSIILYLLPAHPNHTMQSQDVGSFGPFKSRFESQCGEFLAENPSRIVTRYDICRLVAKTYSQVMIPEVIVGIFSTLGIVPYNPNVAARILTAAKCPPVTEQVAMLLPSNKTEGSAEVKAIPQAGMQLITARPLRLVVSLHTMASRNSVVPQLQTSQQLVASQAQSVLRPPNPRLQEQLQSPNQHGHHAITPTPLQLPQADMQLMNSTLHTGQLLVAPKLPAAQLLLNREISAVQRPSDQPQQMVKPRLQQDTQLVSPHVRVRFQQIGPRQQNIPQHLQAVRRQARPRIQAVQPMANPLLKTSLRLVNPPLQPGQELVGPHLQACQQLVNPLLHSGQTGQLLVTPRLVRLLCNSQSQEGQVVGSPRAGEQVVHSTPGVGQQVVRSTPGVGQQVVRSTPGVGQQVVRSTPGVGQQVVHSTPGVGQQVVHSRVKLEWVSKWYAQLQEWVSKWYAQLQEWVSKWYTQLQEWVSKWYAQLQEWVSKWYAQLQEWVRKWYAQLQEWVSKWYAPLQEWVSKWYAHLHCLVSKWYAQLHVQTSKFRERSLEWSCGKSCCSSECAHCINDTVTGSEITTTDYI